MTSASVFCLLAVLGTEPAEAQTPASAASSDVPAALRPLFEAKGADGKPVLPPALAQYFSALPSHTKTLFAQASQAGMLASAEQLKTLLSLDLSSQGMEVALQDNCILCHTNPDNQDERTLFTLDPRGATAAHHASIKEFVSDVHFRRGLSCSGCHGGATTDTDMSDAIYKRWPAASVRGTDRTWIPEFCGRCHSDPAFMRGFNPGMPTDQLAKYKDSQHGIRLLGAKDSKAAQCVSCHGVHGIRSAKSRLSSVHPQTIPSTCGGCHADAAYMAGYRLPDNGPLPTNQLAEYKTSVHGRALLERGDLGAPACNDCHGNHAAMPPAVASVSQVCRTCHSLNGSLFDGSKHKQAFEANRWPECGQCHNKHAIAKTSDAMVGAQSGTLCHDCHRLYAQNNPLCDTTAAHFRATLDELAAGERSVSSEVEVLAEKGLDIEPLATSINELSEALTQARARVHSFDTSTFDKVADPGRSALENGQKLVTAARAEYRFRRNGLLAAVLFVSLLALAIYLKVRQIEKRG